MNRRRSSAVGGIPEPSHRQHDRVRPCPEPAGETESFAAAITMAGRWRELPAQSACIGRQWGAGRRLRWFVRRRRRRRACPLEELIDGGARVAVEGQYGCAVDRLGGDRK